MPDDIRKLKDSIGGLADSSPVIAAGKGIAKVGELAQRGAETAKRMVGKLTASTPTVKRGRDMHLPYEKPRRKTSAGKSMRKR